MTVRTTPKGLVTILANADCPHCVQATDRLTEWCCTAAIPVAGVDVSRHPEIALRRDLEGSPAVLYDSPSGARVFAGFPTHDQFDRLVR